MYGWFVRRVNAWRILPSLLLLSLPGALGGCVAVAAAAGAEAASVAVFGRDIVDIGVSAVTGRDCSIVRLDRRQPYCAPREALPAPPLFCSRTLGTVECWSDPESFVSVPHSITDTPSLTPDQVRQVVGRWPKSLDLGPP